MKVAFTILGEPASKANSRKLATVGAPDARRMLFIKSEKARNYERDALVQIPPRCRVQMTGPVRVTMTIFYASERPDLDESIVLDVMQDRWTKPTGADKAKFGEKATRKLLQKGVYGNDRQVRSKRIDFAIDAANPRAEIEVEAMSAQQVGMPQDLFDECEIPF